MCDMLVKGKSKQWNKPDHSVRHCVRTDSAFYLARLSRGYKFKVTQPTHVAQTPWHPSVTLWCDICGGQSGGKYVTTLLPLTWLFYVAVVIQGENNSNGVGKVNLMF